MVVGGDGLAAPGVAAPGDVARWPHPLLDHEPVRSEHYSSAVDQGRQAARALLGDPLGDRSAPLASFWSHQFDWLLQSVGFTGSRFDFTMVDRDDAGRFTGEYRHRGRLVGAITNGRRRDLVAYRARLLDQAPWRPEKALGLGVHPGARPLPPESRPPLVTRACLCD